MKFVVHDFIHQYISVVVCIFPFLCTCLDMYDRGNEKWPGKRQFRSYILVRTYIWNNRKTIAKIPVLLSLSNYLVIRLRSRRRRPCQASCHQPWDSCRILIDCDGYSCASVANDGSFESPRPSPLIRVVGLWSSGQQRRRYGRSAGSIESSSRFDRASGS